MRNVTQSLGERINVSRITLTSTWLVGSWKDDIVISIDISMRRIINSCYSYLICFWSSIFQTSWKTTFHWKLLTWTLWWIYVRLHSNLLIIISCISLRSLLIWTLLRLWCTRLVKRIHVYLPWWENLRAQLSISGDRNIDWLTNIIVNNAFESLINLRFSLGKNSNVFNLFWKDQNILKK